ncbi:MAG: hypothetical protein ABJC63_00490 [Gemmatimonadales bacterium]
MINMRPVVKFLLLAELFAVTTFGLGWWSVPLVAAVWGLVSRSKRKAMFAALAALGGWTTLFLLDVARGPVATMGSQLGGVMNLPAFGLYAFTLIFPALLAWCAATLVPSVRSSGA